MRSSFFRGKVLSMRAKKVLFGCVLLLLIIGVCELASYVGLGFFLKTYDVRERTGRLMQWVQREPLITLSPTYDPLRIAERARNVLHPYLGFVRDPVSPGMVTGIGNEKTHSYGFADIESQIVRETSPDDVVIGIFGGSVAERLAYSKDSMKIITDAVASIPRYKAKNPVLTMVALSGYKQPQQLMAYNYLLSLGAHIDVIITLDGFNEVTLGLTENVPKNIFSVYPRGWRQFSIGSDPATYTVTYELADKRSFFAALMQSRPVRWSMTSRLFWMMIDASYERQIIVSEMHPHKAEPLVQSYAVSGPRMSDVSTQAVQSLNVDIWSNSIEQMSNLAKANGAVSFHFLQPNQYVPHTKQIGPEEAAIALKPEFIPYAAQVPTGYPLLQKAGKDLQRKGVHFDDLTYVFASHAEPLYNDPCCHFSNAGSVIIAHRIADALRSAFER